jgi:uncharacterized protein DUF2490
VRRLWPAAVAAIVVLAGGRDTHAQTNFQLWGDATIDWKKSSRLAYTLDVEPKVLLSSPAEGTRRWWALDVTPAVDYAPANWLDVTGELLEAYTAQADSQNSLEITPRAGVRLHLFSRDLPTIERRGLAGRERPPRRRLSIRDYLRVELRNFLYSDSTPSSSTWRFRNRIEMQYALNREKITDDGSRYFLSDWEWFVPLDDPTERFASKQRVRAGFGYRQDARWQFEALYIWGMSRDSNQDKFHTADNMIDIRVKRAL